MIQTLQHNNLNKKPVNIMIADDHSLVLEGFSRVLKEFHNVEKIDTFTNGAAVDRALQTMHYDVYIIDLKLPDMDGFELIENIRKVHPNAKILVCTMNEDVWIINRLLRSQVNGIVFKNSPLEHIGKALQKIVAGSEYYCPRFTVLKEHYEEYRKNAGSRTMQLTNREMESLGYIVKGLNTHEIALQMCVSDSCVEYFRKNLFEKTGVRNVAQLVAYAYENKLVGKH
jgi:DNA-binding NarL/FixJ family response regulator